MDWLITIPKTTKWSMYQRELDAVATWEGTLNYRTRYIPKDMQEGDRCFVVHDGRVRGWMKVVGVMEAKQHWRCTVTGHWWPPGKYIQRAGPFHAIDGPAIKGFRGIRRYEEGVG